ncbi:hypothetical protein FE257_003066 [Aspergillus nanangensis]|uniref:Carboxylic ester hydrolase n=1 Tax=Aspergillus nanangensis TaxID=2582783 RepID=A0AAD4CDD2_ASPNN|nr:hypothetical protein FE257_003066 [Aspergillus nanangensis]
MKPSMKLFLSAVLPALSLAASNSTSVTVDAGTIQGAYCEGGQNAAYYKSIPYAEPPIGDLRFEPPKPYKKQFPNGKLDATTPAPSCIQFGNQLVPPGAKSEDCLFLDVWTPSGASKDSKLPVKVWIYGGSNTNGGISDGLFDGCNTADDGSILVSINYRLGPLGFMALSGAGINGNQGIQDLLLGLEWVHSNIAAFGGDPDKVLLFGQSAGAEDAFILASLPQAPSLIHGLISESGGGKRLAFNSTLQSVGASYSQALHCDSDIKSCLQSKTVAELQRAYATDAFLAQGIGADGPISIGTPGAHVFYPYVDGSVIPEEPLRHGSKVPAVFGFNKNEGVIYDLAQWSTYNTTAFTPSVYKTFLRKNFGPAASTVEKHYNLSSFGQTRDGIAAAISAVITDSNYKCPAYEGAVQTARSNIPVWSYEFTHNNTCAWMSSLSVLPKTAIPLIGATHTAEIPFVFGNLDRQPLPGGKCNGTEEEYALSVQMMGLWTAMAENADPSTEAIQWPRFVAGEDYTTPGVVFEDEATVGEVDFSACELWSQVLAELGANGTVVTAEPTSSPSSSGGATVLPTFGGVLALVVLLMELAVFA